MDVIMYGCIVVSLIISTWYPSLYTTLGFYGYHVMASNDYIKYT